MASGRGRGRWSQQEQVREGMWGDEEEEVTGKWRQAAGLGSAGVLLHGADGKKKEPRPRDFSPGKREVEGEDTESECDGEREP